MRFIWNLTGIFTWKPLPVLAPPSLPDRRLPGREYCETACFNHALLGLSYDWACPQRSSYLQRGQLFQEVESNHLLESTWLLQELKRVRVKLYHIHIPWKLRIDLLLILCEMKLQSNSGDMSIVRLYTTIITLAHSTTLSPTTGPKTNQVLSDDWHWTWPINDKFA